VSRDWRLYADDIMAACSKIVRYTSGLSKEQFLSDDKTYDAVLHNLEVIGEAAKNLPDDAKDRKREMDWRKIVGLRSVIAHGYFGLDPDILWDIVSHKVPQLREAIHQLIEKR